MTAEEKLAEIRRVLRDDLIVGASPLRQEENLNFEYLRGRDDYKSWVNGKAHEMLRMIEG